MIYFIFVYISVFNSIFLTFVFSFNYFITSLILISLNFSVILFLVKIKSYLFILEKQLCFDEHVFKMILFSKLFYKSGI